MTILYIPNPTKHLHLTTTLLTSEGLVHREMTILSLITHFHVVPKP